jgi:hypothetical protein
VDNRIQHRRPPEGWDGHNVIAVSFEDDGNAYKAPWPLLPLSRSRLTVVAARETSRDDLGKIIKYG